MTFTRFLGVNQINNSAWGSFVVVYKTIMRIVLLLVGFVLLSDNSNATGSGSGSGEGGFFPGSGSGAGK